MPEFPADCQGTAQERQERGADEQQIQDAPQSRAAGHENAQLTVAKAHPQEKQGRAGQGPEQGVGPVADAPPALTAVGPQKIVHQGDHRPGAQRDGRLIQL